MQLLMCFKKKKKEKEIALNIKVKPWRIGQGASSNIKQIQNTKVTMNCFSSRQSAKKKKVLSLEHQFQFLMKVSSYPKGWPFTHLLTSALSIIFFIF